MEAASELQQRVSEHLGYSLPAQSANGMARLAAVDAALSAPRTPTSLVGYHSRGRLLVIACDDVRALLEPIAAQLDCTLLVTDTSKSMRPTGKSVRPTGRGTTPVAEGVPAEPRVVYAELQALVGYLGQFEATVSVAGENVALAPMLGSDFEHFDLVLDLSDPPRIARAVLPPGYYAPGSDAGALDEALAAIPGMIGEFEKPKYFRYQSDICAHGSRGIVGCTRCLQTCPTGAIMSLGERIEVDPFLCQGAGSCASACPTGAITYAYPSADDLGARLRRQLERYRATGGVHPVLLFHGAETGRAALAAMSGGLPEHVIPIEIEEPGSIGMDVWLTVIAYGASAVLLCPVAVPSSVFDELEHQLACTRSILGGMGYPLDLLRFVRCDMPADPGDVPDSLIQALQPVTGAGIDPARHDPPDEKRTTIRMAVEHLHGQAPAPVPSVELPVGAPFGQITVDEKTCTLCMACVSVCPAGALNSGGERPILDFIEANCVQCGICATACPEDSIALHPRYLYDEDAQRRPRTLNTDQPFACVSCGKEFATARVMTRMREKLQDHWMFQQPAQMKRLEMCEDCRVKDMLRDGGGLVDTQRG